MSGQTTKARPAKPATKYEDDLYTWVFEQVALLRAGRLSEVDALNVAEELSDVGNEQLGKLESAIAVLAQHLLKWDHQPRRRSRSWVLTIREQRRRINRLLKKNPGLKSMLDEALDNGYSEGRNRALAETNLAEIALPDVCPYPFDDMMTREIEVD
jgi:Domain of unknown function DUF29